MFLLDLLTDSPSPLLIPSQLVLDGALQTLHESTPMPAAAFQDSVLHLRTAPPVPWRVAWYRALGWWKCSDRFGEKLWYMYSIQL